MSNPALESRGKGAVIMPYSCPAKKIKDKDKKPTGTGIILSELYSPRKGKHKDCWISTSPGLEKMKLTSSTGRSILKTILKQV